MVENIRKPVIDFSGYITERTTNFTGREWVFQAINDWLADPIGSRFFLLTGEPGSGKTAIVSRLVQFSQGTVPPPDGLVYLNPGFLSAIHFCSTGDSLWNSPQVFSESLAIQLAARYPAYAKALAETSGDRPIHIEVKQDIGQGQGIGVVINMLDIRDLPPEETFIRAVRKPLEALSRSELNHQVVILVDALDETLLYSGAVNILSLLARADYLPTGIRFIVTSRPEEKVQSELRRSNLEVKQHALTSGQGLICSLADVLRHVLDKQREWALKLSSDLELTDFAVAVQKKSDGNFLYVKYLLRMLATQPEQITHQSLDALPIGLEGIYYDYLWRLVGNDMDAWENRYASILGTFAVAQEALTEIQLTDLVGIERSRVRRVLTDLSQFLDVDNSSPASLRTYAIYHRTFADFLLDENKAEKFWCEGQKQHQRIIDYYRNRCGDEWSKLIEDGYACRNVAIHMVGAGMHEALYNLVAKGEIRNEWAEAHIGVEGSYTGYLHDLGLIWNWAMSKKGWNIGYQIRCTLIESSIRSLAGNLPPVLLSQMVKAKLRSPAGALAYILQIPDGKQFAEALTVIAPLLPDELKVEAVIAAREISSERIRTETLIGLLEHLPEGVKAEVILEALVGARGLVNVRARALALIKLLTYLSEELKANVASEVLVATRQIRDEWARSEVLIALAGHLPEELKTQAVVVVRGIANEEARREALTAFVGYLSEGLKVEVLREVLALTQRMKDEEAHALALIKLAGCFPKELRTNIVRKALDLVWGIENERLRVQALSKLIVYLPEELKAEVALQVLRVARKIGDEEIKGRALSKLIVYLPEELKAEMACEAWSIGERVTNRQRRHNWLLDLIDYLPEQLKTESIRQLVAVTLQISDERTLVQALGGLIVYLPKKLYNEVTYYALATVRRIKDESICIQALSGLVAQLPEELKVETAREVLALLSEIGNEQLLAQALTGLVSHLPDELKVEALVMACHIGHVEIRGQALSSIVAYLPYDLKVKALTEAREISDKEVRVQTLSIMLNDLPKELKDEVAYEVLAAARKMANKGERVQALSRVIGYLPEKLSSKVAREVLVEVRQLINKWLHEQVKYMNDLQRMRGMKAGAIQTTRQLDKQEAWGQILRTVLGYLPEKLRGEIAADALTVGNWIINERLLAQVLSGLVTYLPEDLKIEALTLTSKLKNEPLRAQVLNRLVEYLPEKLKPKALAVVCEIVDEGARAEVLSGVAMHLPERLQVEALAQARSIVNKQERVRVMSGIAPYLPDELKTKVINEAVVVADEIVDNSSRTEALINLLDHLTNELKVKALREALVRVKDVERSEDRASMFTQIVSHWKEINFSGLAEEQGIITGILRVLARYPRSELMRDLGALTPLLSYLGGHSTIDEMFFALRDVSRWWP